MALKRECIESVNRVIKMIQEDNTVIFIWSYYISVRAPLYNLFTGTRQIIDRANQWEFRSKLVKHPTSGAEILLISMPDADNSLTDEKKQGLQHILSQMDKVGVRSSVHIWAHDNSERRRLWPRKPKGWDFLKQMFEGDLRIEMNNMIFLSMDWDVDSEEDQGWEGRIKEALKEDVERGLAFVQLPVLNEAEIWYVIDGIMDLMTATVHGKGGVGDDRSRWLGTRINGAREEAKKKAKEDSNVGLMQREIRQLYAELEKTEYGKGVRAKLKKVSGEQKKIMVPLLTQLDNDDMKPEEKEQLEKTIKEEYDLFLREFRGYFAEVKAMGIQVGFHLRDFYGLPEPRKKRLGIF